MILRFPSGLYQDAGQLPVSSDDAGNITFTISNDTPKRSEALVVQLPLSEEIRPAPDPVYDESVRREAFGELIYTLVETNRTFPGSNQKTFDIGELLDFDDEEITLPESINVPKQVDLQHNTNLLDLVSTGLTNEEIKSITALSETRKLELEQQIADLRKQINDQQTQIQENQKQINETRKLINAVLEITTPDDPIVSKLQTREANLVEDRTELINSVNNLNNVLRSTFDSLIKVSELVH